jgi:universal stress protein E
VNAIRQIIVAIKEPEARASAAVIKAAQLARALGAKLELFHAMTWPLYAISDPDFQQLQSQERARVIDRLEKLGGRLKARGRQRPLQISVAAVWDAPGYEAIIRRATAIHADLIVAGRNGDRHFTPSLLRFTDWELLRNSPVPVLLVKRGGTYHRPVILAAVDPSHSLDKPARLDGAILAASSGLSRALGGRLHAVHAYAPVSGGMHRTGALDAEAAATLNRKLTAAAFKRYDRLLDGYDIRKARRHLLAIPPADAIEEVAIRARADIVALGAISRSGWERLLIGNTAEEVLDPLPCDLLIVKPPHFRARIPRRPTGPRYRAPILFSP